MKKAVLLLFVLFTAFQLKAQNPILDSLRNQLIEIRKIQKNDSLEIIILGKICQYSNYFKQKDTETWLSLLRDKKNNPLANGLYNLYYGNYLISNKSDYTEAAKYLFDAEKIFRANKDDYHLCKSILQILLIAMWNSGKGELLYKQNSSAYKSSKEYGAEALEIAYRLNNASLITLSNVYLANFYFSPTQKKDFEKLILDASKYVEKADDYHVKAMYYITAMLLYWDVSKKEQFEKTGQKALQLANKNTDYYVMNRVNVNYMFWYEKTEPDKSKAEKYGNEAYRIAQLFQNKELITDTEFHIASFYQTFNDFENAFKFQKLHYTHEQEIKRNQAEEKYNELQTQYQAKQQRLTIKELENKNLLQVRNFLLILGLISLLSIIYVIRTNRKLKKNNIQLTDKNQEIAQALYQGQTMERKRMASELHDNIANKILAVKMRVELFDDAKLNQKGRKNYEDTLRFIDEVYSDVRLVSHNLLPEELEKEGLKTSLENLVRKVNLINRTHFELEFENLDQRFALNFEYEIYSTILELVNNILKHAKAKNALLTLKRNNQTLNVNMKDDGKGFDTEKIDIDSMGLKSIRSRIESLKGTINFLNQNGTEVSIEVPA